MGLAYDPREHAALLALRIVETDKTRTTEHVEYDDKRGLILVRAGLNQVQQRCAIAVGVQLAIVCRVPTEKCIRHSELRATLALVDHDEFGEAMRAELGQMARVARRLNVTLCVAWLYLNYSSDNARDVSAARAIV